VTTIDLPKTAADVIKLLDLARSDDVIVRLSDGSEFLLISIDEFDHEVAKGRNHPRLMALLEARAAQPTTTSLDDVKRQLQL
jgi:hypothetical protein